MDVTSCEISRFEQDGFLIVNEIFSRQEVKDALAAMDRVYHGVYNRDIRPFAARKLMLPFGTSSSVRWILNARLVDSDLWEIAVNSTRGLVAARLLRTDSVSVIEDQLLDKPGGGVPVNLHQDYSYWRFSTSPKMLTCWIALDDMTLDMGPIELLRGSQCWGISMRPRELIHGSVDEYRSGAVLVKPEAAEFDFVPVVVPRGGGVFFHSLTFHGSRGNSTGHLRRAMSIHWASGECLLDRSRLSDYAHPYLFSRLRQGDRLVNMYIPQAYPATT
jgi:ectoine hydroxylase-related dioxygenase (phytanoyl-CoA dioxygenase family)